LQEIEEAVQILLLENNTNFDSLIKNLENHEDLYDLTFRILIEGDKVAFNPDNSVIKLGILYGVFKRNGSVKIHNRIYEQRIYNYMASNIEVGLRKASDYNFENQFYLPKRGLDVEKILVKFQEFMKIEYSDQDQAFLEREWRLIFLAFIRPIVNGNGYTFKEPQISQEKRLDVVITFFQHQYIAELKRWNGEKLHQEGIQQLSDYLDLQNQTKGFLVIFEYRTKKTWRKEWIQYDNKEIFAVWV
ncbi:MAG: GxxExxY protein, partial [Chitinophagales bacterium]